MRVNAIRRAYEDELGRPVFRSTVKACLSDHSSGARPRFQRVGPGLYTPLMGTVPSESAIPSGGNFRIISKRPPDDPTACA
jgi:hypothetical protein